MLSGRPTSARNLQGTAATRRPASAPVTRVPACPPATESLVKNATLKCEALMSVVAPKPIRPSSAGPKVGTSSSGSPGPIRQRPLSATKRRLTSSQFIPTDTADWITELYQLEPTSNTNTPSPQPILSQAKTQDSEYVKKVIQQPKSSPPVPTSVPQSVPQFPSPAPDLDPHQTAALLPDPTSLPIDLFDDINPPRPPFPNTVQLVPPPILALPTWPNQLSPTSPAAPTGTSLFHDLDCPTWTYDWSPCHILSFDPLTNRFLIHFPTIRVDKWVTRLNLCFDCESRAAFNARRSAAWFTRAQWQAQVEMWHQVAAVRLRTPRMPDDVSQRIVNRLMALGGAWKGIKKRPRREDWADKLSEHEWHWMFAMKQAAMVGPTRNDRDVVAVRSVHARKVLPGDGSIVAWDGAWAAVTSIRASLMDVLEQSFAAEFAELDGQKVVAKPVQDWCKAMSAKCARIQHRVLVDWRAAATKAIAQVSCLGHIYLKVPRLVDCLVHTLFQQAVDRMHSAMLDAARVDQEIGAPFTRPRLSVEAVIESSGDSRHLLRLEPTAVQARQLLVQVVAELNQALSERWTSFSSDSSLVVAGNDNSSDPSLSTQHRRHTLVAPDPTPALLHLARAYTRGDTLLSHLSTCLWLLDPGPESVCYTHDRPTANADCTWRTDMISRIDTVLTNLAQCRPLLFDRSFTAATVGDIVHFDLGTAVRRLRARWRVWDACCRKQLAHVFATACAQLERIYATATQALHISGVGTDAGTWSVLADTLAQQNAQLDLAHGVAEQLASWWTVCYAHQVDLDDAESERYWSAVAIPRQLAWEYAVANEDLARARQNFVDRVRVASAHIEGSLGAHVIELMDIGRERHVGEAVKVARRVAALRARVEKLVTERDGVMNVHKAIGMRTDEMEPGQHRSHDEPMWPGVMALMGKVLRASRLWDTTVAIQDALATYRKTFFTQLPRDALGAQLVGWKDTLVGLLMEHPSHAPEDVNARQVVDQVHEQCAAIANIWPILYALSSPHLQMRHWFQITKRIGLAAHDLDMLTLEQVLDQKLDLLTDILLTGSGAHRLSGWETWDMPLTEVAMREREKRGANKSASSVTSSNLAGAGTSSLDNIGHTASLLAPPLPPGQEALTITIRNNSIHLDAVANGPHLWPSITRTIAGAHGPTTKTVNRHQVTIPFTRIVSIQIRPPDARRYLTRELEWLAWNGAKKLASLTVGGEQGDRLDCVNEEEDDVPAVAPTQAAFLTTPASSASTVLSPTSPETKPATTTKSHPTVPTVSTTISGHTAVRRGIWCTRRGNVFYYVACSTEESVGDPVLEAQLMGQSAIALYLEPAEDEMPLAKVVVSVPRGVSPELFAERVQNACAREIIME